MMALVGRAAEALLWKRTENETTRTHVRMRAIHAAYLAYALGYYLWVPAEAILAFGRMVRTLSRTENQNTPQYQCTLNVPCVRAATSFCVRVLGFVARLGTALA